MSEINYNRCRRCGVYAGEELTWHDGCVYCTNEDDETEDDIMTIAKIESFEKDNGDVVIRNVYAGKNITKEKNDNEVYHGMIGQRLGRYWWASSFEDDTEGSPGQVSFDWEKIMNREDSHGDVVGFYHTHPNFLNRPSSTDYATMGAWTLSLGRPLLCLIEGTDGLGAHWFKDDETQHKTGKVWKLGKFLFGTVPTFE